MLTILGLVLSAQPLQRMHVDAGICIMQNLVRFQHMPGGERALPIVTPEQRRHQQSICRQLLSIKGGAAQCIGMKRASKGRQKAEQVGVSL